jgi:hypothetical protein
MRFSNRLTPFGAPDLERGLCSLICTGNAAAAIFAFDLHNVPVRNTQRCECFPYGIRIQKLCPRKIRTLVEFAAFGSDQRRGMLR